MRGLVRGRGVCGRQLEKRMRQEVQRAVPMAVKRALLDSLANRALTASARDPRP